MPFTTIISPADLRAHLDDANWVVVDARFALTETERGRGHYLQAHIPGAVYAHLEEDLSGPVRPGVTGRHPLPDVATAAATFSRFGIGPEVQVVAYDDVGGALAAARVWWLLRWLGHDAVAVLDGGWQAWLEAQYPLVEQRAESRQSRRFEPRPRSWMVAEVSEVDAARQDATWRVLDARAADRFRGKNETIDPVAGHIPGAVSAPFAGNLNPNGTFRPVERLRERFLRLLGDVPASRAIVYCGSGVTAAHNVLAIEYAGLGQARLYAGSWSEWITDARRPVTTEP